MFRIFKYTVDKGKDTTTYLIKAANRTEAAIKIMSKFELNDIKAVKSNITEVIFDSDIIEVEKHEFEV